MSISTQPAEVDAKFARDAWLRALAKTANIGERGTTLPHAGRALGLAIRRRAGAHFGAQASMSYAQLGVSLQSIFALGHWPRVAKRRCRRAAYVQLRRVSGHLAGIDADRRGRCADQFTACRRGTRAFDRNRRSQVPDRRRRSRAARRGDPRAPAGGDEVPRSGNEPRFRAARAGTRGVVGRAADGCRARSAADRCHRALHLYLGHDRIAESRQGQPLPAHAVEPLVCRHDGYDARGSHVQLPAAVPQRRRRGRDVCDAGQRRRGGDSPAVFCVGFLARCARRALHLVPVHRRTMPLLGQQRAPAGRNRTLPADGLRQWAAAGGLGAVPNRVSKSRESSSITPPPKAIFRSTTARDSPAPSAAYRLSWRTGCPWRCCDSTLKNRSRGATPRASASAARRMKWARPSG